MPEIEGGVYKNTQCGNALVVNMQLRSSKEKNLSLSPFKWNASSLSIESRQDEYFETSFFASLRNPGKDLFGVLEGLFSHQNKV
jgi:hypothetical protein